MMSHKDQPPLAPVFRPFQGAPAVDPIPSSSPAFGTPSHAIGAQQAPRPHQNKPVILPVLLPPASLRPLAFRTFTKKHNLTLTSSALQVLATFIGKHCGAGWREEGLAELVLEEVAKLWKKNGGSVIVEGNAEEFKLILKDVAGYMVGGRIPHGKTLSRQPSFALVVRNAGRAERPEAQRGDSQTSLGLSELAMGDGSEEEDEQESTDPRAWLKVIGAFEQPRMTYNLGKKHFEREKRNPSLMPPAAHKTQLFHQRYNIIHQRVLRNESFQQPTFANARIPSLQHSSSSLATTQRFYKLTPIANLLGRNGSSHHLLGLLTVAPTGTLAICDPTGSITLDVQQARAVPEDGAWFVPGMMVLVEGVYEEEYNSAGGVLGNSGGIGGTIGGRFVGFEIGGPPCERREVTLGLSGTDGGGAHFLSGGGFGWVDFLGVGSERALGSKMRRLEERVFAQGQGDAVLEGRERVVVLGDVKVDDARTLEGLKKVLIRYASSPAEKLPMAIVLMGNFVSQPAMAGSSRAGSIEYKEGFNALAAVLAEVPLLLQYTTFIFVPGDNDPWASAFSAGASTVLPRKPIPELFTSRIKRAFNVANAEAERPTTKTKKSGGGGGEAIWTTNPARISLFGPSQEIVLFRDDMSSRLRRNAIRCGSRLQPDTTSPTTTETEQMDIDLPPPAPPTVTSKTTAETASARKLTKTLLDQSHLSPFSLSTRPILWDHLSCLQLYPLPTALIMVDPNAPTFAVTYEGCHVLNAGALLCSPAAAGSSTIRGGEVVRWVEYDARIRRGRVRELVL